MATVLKTYYIDGSSKKNIMRLREIRQEMDLFMRCKPVEMDYIECSFRVPLRQMKKLEKKLAPLV